MDNILTVVLLVALVILSWKVAYKKTSSAVPATLNEWIILVSHKIKDAGDVERATWDSDAPVILEFVPIIGWDRGQTGLTPITPPGYHVSDRLNVSRLDKNAKHQTLSYCIRDGAVFDIPDMSHSDFWEDVHDYASYGHEIEIRGAIPDYYRPRFAEIFQESERHRAERKNQQESDT